MDISFQPIQHYTPTPALNNIAKNDEKGKSRLYVIVGIVAAAVFATWLIVSTPVATIAKTVIVAPIVVGLGITAGIAYFIYRKLSS
jgi:hypothetical protein